MRSLRALEAIANVVIRRQIFWIRRVVFKLFPELTDVGAQVFLFVSKFISPYQAKEFVV